MGEARAQEPLLDTAITPRAVAGHEAGDARRRRHIALRLHHRDGHGTRERVLHHPDAGLGAGCRRPCRDAAATRRIAAPQPPGGCRRVARARDGSRCRSDDHGRDAVPRRRRDAAGRRCRPSHPRGVRRHGLTNATVALSSDPAPRRYLVLDLPLALAADRALALCPGHDHGPSVRW